MVITKTPFRMSFFGGGTDYEEFFKEFGGSVISTTFDRYCYVTVRHLPRFFDYSTRIAYSKVENVSSIDEIVHPSVRETMRFLDMKHLHVSYDADLPARTGLGSSSSFVVGMLNSFYAMEGKYVDKKRLAEEAIYIERTLCKEDGGIQDQIAAAYGGFNRLFFREDGFRVTPIVMREERKQQLNENLMLFFTGFSRFSSDIAKSQKKATKSKIEELKHMLALVDEAEKVLFDAKSDLNDFGRLLHESWTLKRGLTSDISNDSIDVVYNRALKSGALGGKLLGAGGGGFLLFYVEKDKQEKVRESLKDLLYVPFGFENDGSRVIYYAAEKYES